jgi:hypothetical protein
VNPTFLTATLTLEAALPALALLAPHDAELRRAASGPRPFAVTLSVRGLASRRRLAFAPDGTVTTDDSTTPGAPASSRHPFPRDLRLWFPTANQFLRATANRPALALPHGNLAALGQLSRFKAAGRRLEQLLRDPAVHPALFAYGNLAVGLAGACAWLRHHPDAPARRAALGDGLLTFACPALPAPLWIDLAALTSGTGPAPRPPVAELTFATLGTLLAELAHTLDALAALGGGELRIRGHLLIAERLSLVLNEVSRLLNPPS